MPQFSGKHLLTGTKVALYGESYRPIIFDKPQCAKHRIGHSLALSFFPILILIIVILLILLALPSSFCWCVSSLLHPHFKSERKTVAETMKETKPVEAMTAAFQIRNGGLLRWMTRMTQTRFKRRKKRQNKTMGNAVDASGRRTNVLQSQHMHITRQRNGSGTSKGPSCPILKRIAMRHGLRKVIGDPCGIGRVEPCQIGTLQTRFTLRCLKRIRTQHVKRPPRVRLPVRSRP